MELIISQYQWLLVTIRKSFTVEFIENYRKNTVISVKKATKFCHQKFWNICNKLLKLRFYNSCFFCILKIFFKKKIVPPITIKMCIFYILFKMQCQNSKRQSSYFVLLHWSRVMHLEQKVDFSTIIKKNQKSTFILFHNFQNSTFILFNFQK